MLIRIGQLTGKEHIQLQVVWKEKTEA